jgi:uncharacterized membrane protein
MKKSILIPVAIIACLSLLSLAASAQVQYYGVDIDIAEKTRSSIKMTLTFEQPETNFDFNIIGKIGNFAATSNAGPIYCAQNIGGISYVNCTMNLTAGKRTVEITFETDDFVKTLEKTYFFDADMSINKDIGQVFVSAKLPQGTGFLTGDASAAKISYYENSTKITDGRRIIIQWNLNNIQARQPLRFQFLYENVEIAPVFSIRLRYFVLMGLVAAAIIAFLVYRYKIKPENLVLSVLDDYERKVIDIIDANKGVANQKKIVQETNLSKAKISRVVKSLAERGLIEVERRGRTNILKIVKKKLRG